ncbi:MAG TPA: hypothetical protein VFP18_01530, partial [Candidatus Binatia bacterium]|nr:hypothetical protein [Candidatus Binatia bacterium]
DTLFRGSGSAGLLAGNIVESADRPLLRYTSSPEHYLEFTASYVPSSSHKVFKFHNVNQVYLI